MWNQGGYQDQGQGGFSSPGGFGTPQGTQGDRKSRNRAQNILPCTTAEILSATQNDDKFYSGEIELSQITIVGLIIAVKESPTRIDYEVDDMTGPPLEVKQFVDNDESVPEPERIAALRENTYVRVYGTVRSFGGKRNVTAFKMVPVMDMNEVTYHMLEVTHSHLALSKHMASGMSSGAPTSSSTMGDNIYNNQDSGMISGLNQIQNQVHSIIQSNVTEEGASIENVCKQLRGVPERSVREAIEFLSVMSSLFVDLNSVRHGKCLVFGRETSSHLAPGGHFYADGRSCSESYKTICELILN